MFGFIKKIFGSAQDRKLKHYRKLVKEINHIDLQLDGLTDDAIKGKKKEFIERLSKGETTDQILPEAYAVVKNTCKRISGQRFFVMGHELKWEMIPFDVQIVGAIAMHYGNIAEMQTGEGKTLTATMPIFLNSLTGKQVHVVTVNDYLAQRDCEWNKPIFDFLGMTVGFISPQMQHMEKKHSYTKEILYATASEFGFDYLRDNSIATKAEHQVQKDHFFGIIDEIDFILIDDARTPLRISGPSHQSSNTYAELKLLTESLVIKQKDLCNKLANKAWKSLDLCSATSPDLDSFSAKFSKEDEQTIKTAIKELWVVSKGMPKNKLLRKAKEFPFLRTLLDSQDLLAYGDNAVQERLDILAKLYVIVDEKNNDFELSDIGIKKWKSIQKKMGDGEELFNFELTDLNEECEAIDLNEKLSDSEKSERKCQLFRKEAKRKDRAHAINQMLRAHLLMEKDVDYIVQEDKIVIIDENTGRAQPGRRYSDGLHQAIEAKENVTIQQASITYATITLQNYFKKYEKLTGMSGTAVTDSAEFKQIYNLDVLTIPTKMPCQRKEIEDEIYMTEREKLAAMVKEVSDIHSKGRPILIGTRSVEESERMSRMLSSHRLQHTVLNAKNNAKEADIISQAGQLKSITISTNMAGRGTDIKLGQSVAELGGLHVIGSRHFSRRNDRQLIGRCARQGDPGSSKFFGSFEDDLMRLFASPAILKVLGKFRPPEGESISSRMLTRSIENAQQRIEHRNYASRKHTLEYDNVISKQREEIYSFRQYVLLSNDMNSLALESIYEISSCAAEEMINKGKASKEQITSWLRHECNIYNPQIEETEYKNREDVEKVLYKILSTNFDNKIDMIKNSCTQNQDSLQALMDAIKWILIKVVDRSWQNHISMLDQLKSELHLRTLGQKDPLIEFKEESFAMFKNMIKEIHYNAALDMIKIELIFQDY